MIIMKIIMIIRIVIIIIRIVIIVKMKMTIIGNIKIKITLMRDIQTSHKTRNKWVGNYMFLFLKNIDLGKYYKEGTKIYRKMK